jgi:hypothetical protein
MNELLARIIDAQGGIDRFGKKHASHRDFPPPWGVRNVATCFLIPRP